MSSACDYVVHVQEYVVHVISQATPSQNRFESRGWPRGGGAESGKNRLKVKRACIIRVPRRWETLGNASQYPAARSTVSLSGLPSRKRPRLSTNSLATNRSRCGCGPPIWGSTTMPSVDQNGCSAGS